MTLFHPICEFFQIEWSARHYNSFLNEAKPDQKKLINILKDTKGIYSFYNSEYEIIYLGKTKRNLWDEMKNAYNRRINHYKRYYVSHPRGKFSQKEDGTVRAITERSISMADAAIFFSAYYVEDDDNIDSLEKLLIRMIPNDLLNHRMEGNLTLQAFGGEE